MDVGDASLNTNIGIICSTPLQALLVGVPQIKMPQPYGWGIGLWSWRDSNPRPEMELLCLLHAYRNISFRTKLAVPHTGLIYSLLCTLSSHKHTAQRFGLNDASDVKRNKT